MGLRMLTGTKQAAMNHSGFWPVLLPFSFVVFVTIYQYLSHLSSITVNLQSKAVDIVKAHYMISEIVRTYNSDRANVESSFSHICEVSSDMVKRLEVQLQCLALQQGNKIAAIFQLLLFKSISGEMLQFPFLII